MCESLGVFVCCEWWWTSWVGSLDNEVAVEGVDVNTWWMPDDKWVPSLCNMPDDSNMESVYQNVYILHFT